MTQAEFIGALSQELRRRGEPFTPAQVCTFSEEVWALVPAAPVLAIWTDLFLEGLWRSHRPKGGET